MLLLKIRKVQQVLARKDCQTCIIFSIVGVPSFDMSTTFANAFSQWPVFFCTLPWQIVSPGSSSQSAPEEPRPLSASQPPASRLPPAPPLLSPPKDIKLSFSAIVTVSTVGSLKILPSNLPSEKKSLLLALL